jgi:ATP-dependent DNA helicase DinG
MQYSLPRTILRFKQAFERLLKVQQGRGVVVMLDSRLSRKHYGTLFLNSLPPLHQRQHSLSAMVGETSEWLKKPEQ